MRFTFFVGLALIAAGGCGRVEFSPLLDGGAPIDTARRTYRDVVVEDGPLSYWRLADTTIAVARDEMGRVDGAYEGTCTLGVAGALVDDPDTAAQFDGATCRVALATRTPFDGISPFSLEAWAFHATIPTAPGFQVYVMDQTRDLNPLDGYGLVLSNTVGVYLERSAGGSNRLTPRQLIAPGTWHHVVGTYDGATLSLYIDGVFASSTANVITPVDSTGSLPYLGSQSTPTPTGLMQGVLDEIAVYDHVLSAERVAEHHRVATTGPE
jgi:hypothetical protein